MAQKSSTAELLQVSADKDDESYFRILVDNKFIKYITIEAGLFDIADMCFGPSLFSILPPLPTGDWNNATVSQDPVTGAVHFSAVSRTQFPGIKEAWHPTKIEFVELHMEERLRSNVYEITCPGFDSKIVAKFARFWWEVAYLEAETEAYRWIEGYNIGPEFLGHIVEEGRVIGFLCSRVTNFHHATPEDLSLCQEALSKLHQLGVKHGDTNKHNFLVHEGKITLIDFDMALRADSEDLEKELQGLHEQLCDTSGRGGTVIVD